MPKYERTRLSSLDCIVVDGGPEPSAAVVICHGYGASYDDLAPLAGEWISILGDAAASFRFVFPDAPNSLADLGMPQGRAWWPINMMGLMEAIEAKRFSELHDQQPPGLEEARDQLCGVIETIKADLDGPETPLALGGFSQGAMLTMDVALRGNVPPPNCLIQFSGTTICRPQWTAAMPRLRECEVFQSHGTVDPILPFDSALVLRDMIQKADVALEFHSFVGPHTIDGDSVQRTAHLIGSLVS